MGQFPRLMGFFTLPKPFSLNRPLPADDVTFLLRGSLHAFLLVGCVLHDRPGGNGVQQLGAGSLEISVTRRGRSANCRKAAEGGL